MSLLSFTKKIMGKRTKTADSPRSSAGEVGKQGVPTDKRTKPAASSPKKERTKKAPVITAATTTAAGLIGLTPVVTEKAVAYQGTTNTVVFRASPAATKGQIMTAVATRYKIKPVRVRTLQSMPKVRRRGVSFGKTKAWKKVYVTLPAGKTIDLTQ